MRALLWSIQNPAHELRARKIRAVRIGRRERCAGQHRAHQVAVGQHRHAERRAAQLAARQIAAREIGANAARAAAVEPFGMA